MIAICDATGPSGSCCVATVAVSTIGLPLSSFSDCPSDPTFGCSNATGCTSETVAFFANVWTLP